MLDLPDILVFHAPPKADNSYEYKMLQVVPSYLTEDPQKVGKTRHQQAIDILNRSHMKYEKKRESSLWRKFPMEKEKFPMEEISIVHKLPELISAGSVPLVYYQPIRDIGW